MSTDNINISALLSSDRVVSHAKVKNKNELLELVCALVAPAFANLTSRMIFSHMLEREKQGSTAVGHGVAIPHTRIQEAQISCGAFIHLQEPIEYDEDDHQLVDLCFGLVVPDGNSDKHLQILDVISEKLSHAHFREQLRQANNSQELYDLITK